MSEPIFTEQLRAMLDEVAYMDEEDREQVGFGDLDAFADARVESFEQAGLLTSDEGLVVRTADGHEFQITVVQSR